MLAASLAACRAARPLEAPGEETPSELAAPSLGDETAQAADPDAASNAASDAASDAASPPQGDQQPAKPAAPIRGYVTTRFRSRSTSGADDQDLETALGLDIGNESTDVLSGHVLARLGADLDGTSTPDPFFSLNDTFDHSLASYLYYAWVDVRPKQAAPGQIERWRVGRQIDYLTPELAWFDGLSAQTRASGRQRLQLGGYAGVPTRMYETSADRGAVLGAFAQAEPWKDGRARADWMYLDDETRLAQGDNNLVSLALWQSFLPSLQLEGRYTHLEQDPRDARLQANWFDQEHELSLLLSYYELLHEQKGFALDVDPFLSNLFEQFPYRQVRLLASKSLGESLLLQGGADVRRVSDDADIGEFNRDFERGYLTFTHGDLLPLSLSLSLTGEVWNSSDDDIQTWGLDLSRRLGPELDASIGSYYSLYKYDAFSVEERDDVRTYYLVLRWKQSRVSAFDFRYDFEDSEIGDYQTLRLGATWQL